ncbi:MAG TPA: hypothetical protein DCM86_14775 [Verrucomicrobiales bacterium]|nr:hypothetical protein [Verrucomicrobiales bacterium]
MNTHLPNLPMNRPETSLAGVARLGLHGLLVALGLLLVANEALAQRAAPPDRMSYQGFLVDSGGVPIATATGPTNLTTAFRIYDAALAGNLLWAEQQLVTIDKGNFSVMLGEGSPTSAEPLLHGSLTSAFGGAGASDRYIEVTVGTTRILPRLRLLPSSYSFLASQANSLVRTNTGVSYLSYDAQADRINAGSGLSVAGSITGTGGLSVSGAISGSSLSGNGSGITGLTAGQISGVFGDSLLSANVAMRNANNQFTPVQNFLANVGIGISTAPAFPLSFASVLGDKIGLFPGASGNYGIGVQSSLLQIHTDTSASDIAFGSGTSASMAETLRIKGNGRVGIGTNSPQATVHVASTGSSELLLESTAASGEPWRLSSGTGGAFSILETNTYRITVQKGGAVGIGTTSPTAGTMLEVAGKARIGGGNVTVGDESLRIIRGQVAAGTGVPVIGAGYNVSRTGVGVYKIGFSQAFKDVPVVTLAVFAVGGSATLSAPSTSSITVTTYGPLNVATDLSFNFIAVGTW